MSEGGVVGRVGRRSREEALALVSTYEASGLGRREFCAQHGLAVVTLDLYRKRARQTVNGSQLLAVDVKPALKSVTCLPLTVVLVNGRRIEIGSSLDMGLLTELIGVLELA